MKKKYSLIILILVSDSSISLTATPQTTFTEKAYIGNCFDQNFMPNLLDFM